MTKSGRLSPYFIDMGNLHDPLSLETIGHIYAQTAINNRWYPKSIFGPAYKGILLSISVSLAFSKIIHSSVNFGFNRKEKKQHGEKGNIIGKKFSPKDEIIIVDDVITSGLSIIQTIDLLKKNGNPKIIGIIVAIDRLEKSKEISKLTTRESLSQRIGIPIVAIATINDILREVSLSQDIKEKVLNYQKKYGV